MTVGMPTRIGAAGLLPIVMLVLAGCGGEEPADAPGPPAPPKPGETVTNAVGMKLAYVPPGEFTMGSPVDEPRRQDDEAAHRVTITRGFHIGVTEVTQAQWTAVMGFNPSDPQGDDLPVSKVSWAQATEFCRKLSEKEGAAYRLPTEAEWEYACRAGTAGAYADEVDEMGWHMDNSDEQPQPVGGKKPNTWGLYDMHGNVLEWCADGYARDYGGDATDPTGPTEGKNRAARGGSWANFPRALRSAARANFPPTYAFKQLGFRVVRELPADAKPK